MEETFSELLTEKIIKGKKRKLIRIRRVKLFAIGAIHQNCPDPQEKRLEVSEKFFNVPGDIDEFYAMVMVKKNRKNINAFKKGVVIIGSDDMEYVVTEEFDISQREFRKLLWD